MRMRWALLLAGVVAGLPAMGQSVPEVPARALAQLPPEQLDGVQRLSAARWMVDQALSRPNGAPWQRAWLTQASIYYAAALGDPALPAEQGQQARQALAAIDHYLHPPEAPSPPEVFPELSPPQMSAPAEAFAPQVTESPRVGAEPSPEPVEWMGPEEPPRLAGELARRSVQESTVEPVLTPSEDSPQPPLAQAPMPTPQEADLSPMIDDPSYLQPKQDASIEDDKIEPTLQTASTQQEIPIAACPMLPPHLEALLASHQPGLHWERGPVDHHDFGLGTAMAAERLLLAGMQPVHDAALEQALDDLRGWSLSGTLATAFRLRVASRLGAEWESIKQQDAQALWDAQRDGRWPPTLRPSPDAVIDGCTQLHTFFVIQALLEAQNPRMHQAIPNIVTRTMQSQRDDGGWASWWGDPLDVRSQWEATLSSSALLALELDASSPALQRSRQWMQQNEPATVSRELQHIYQSMQDTLAQKEASDQ